MKKTNLIPLVWMAAGYGDILLLSSVLKKSLKCFPGRRFDLIRTTQKTQLLSGHPAIRLNDYFPGRKKTINANYAAHSSFKSDKVRVFSVLAEIFGLPGGVAEDLFLPLNGVSTDIFQKYLPWGKVNIAIAPDSTSPRKKWPDSKWETLVAALTGQGYFVVQLGKGRKIKGAYSLSGQTTPKEAVKLLTLFDLLITGDGFLMHGAKCMGTPSVVLWGGSSPEIFGYQEHYNIRGARGCGCLSPQCYVLDGGDGFHSECPQPREARCMDSITVEEVLAGTDSILARVKGARPRRGNRR